MKVNGTYLNTLLHLPRDTEKLQ